MKNIIQRVSLVFLATFLIVGITNAEECRDIPARSQKTQKAGGDCVSATGSNQLNVNNVRAYITTAGSMWFRNSLAQYFIPKEGQASSMFASALWIGGKDVAGQLKLAAVQFRQQGDDFWPGPLTLDAANIDQTTCAMYDKIFVMTKKEAQKHRDSYDDNGNKIDPEYVLIPESIRNWPAHPIDGNRAQSPYIAPFFDRNGNGIYEPELGDYPYYDFDNDLCPWTEANRALAARGELPQTMETQEGISTGGIMADQVLKGDQTLWWIFNDKGAAHTETKGMPIGLEIRAQAFGFATTDELNNMTFYSYEIINRSTFELTETFFSQWVDPDVGYAYDDYVGCDVERGLGYCYNGKTPDGNGLPQHYGDNPPAVGVDFFQGPYLDPDGEDNPSFKGDNKYGPSWVANYPGEDKDGCGIVQANGNAYEFTWDSVAKTPTGEDTMIQVTRYVTVRAEAINGVNFGDGIVDNERYGMRRFVYYNNDGDVARGNPHVAFEYYNFLRGIWRNNVRMTYGGTGYNIGSTTECDFMFPGNTDPCNWGTKGVATDYKNPATGWTEESEGNQYGDRRFMQSAGPFTLKAGAINYITVGIPWARAVGAPWESVKLLKIVDDKAQILFESCFKVVEGPDAPDLVFREMDGKLICYLTNAATSSNYKEGYEEEDPSIPKFRINEIEEIKDSLIEKLVCDTLKGSDGNDSLANFRMDTIKVQVYERHAPDTIWHDRKYRFEGYQVFQLADPTVKAGELFDVTKAQLVFQCDIKNNVTVIKNYLFNADVNTEVPTLMVKGADEGILHSFEITKDMFQTGVGDELTNYRKYYYMAIAYGYNCYLPYSTDPTDPPESLFGQKNPYIAGNKNVRVYTVMPHRTAVEENGTVVQSVYGTQPQIIQYEGQGNGGNTVQLSKQTLKEILANGKADSLIFEKDAAPVNVRVIDPLKVVGRDYTLRFCNKDSSMADAVTDDTYWVLEYTNDNGVDTAIYSDTCISVPNEQLLLDLGISIFIEDAKFTPLDDILKPEHPTVYRLLSSVKFLNSSISYQTMGHPWYQGFPDVDGDWVRNWIRAGQTKDGDWTMKDQTWEKIRREDFYIKLISSDADLLKDVSKSQHTIFLDGGKKFEKIIGGTFAPYALASYYDGNPAYGYEVFEDPRDSAERANDVTGGGNPCRITYPTMTELYSVNIVLTADTMLWTRCPVVELCNEPVMAVGRAIRHDLRKSPSIYRNGQPDNSGTTGMGWFPGYAICIETGERLNMMFGENSMHGQYNGADMLFNPTPEFDGRHFLYVFGHRDLSKAVDANSGSVANVSAEYICPAYDEGKWAYDLLKKVEGMQRGTQQQRLLLSFEKNYLYKNVMWTGISMANWQYEWLEKGNDVTIQIRVSRPYQRWSSTTGTGKGANAINNDMPLYKFSTKDIATLRKVKNVVQTQMDSIYITPNPYYGISTGGYEASQVDTRVKIINLPKGSKIKIYTLNGTLIKEMEAPSSDPNPNAITYVEWDLKNSANIPIASGYYLIHITDIEYGFEKTLKFLCIQRPIDVNAF